MDIQIAQTILELLRMNTHVKSIIWWVLYLAMVIGLVYGTPKALSYILQSEYPMAAITSRSMWPTLKKGDMVFIKGIASREEIEIGDIVVYQNLQGFTIHRVERKNEGTVVTKGDANNTEDSPVKYEDIIGKTVTFREKPVRIPWLGNVSIALDKK
mgnify:CR=1 FL=1